MCQMGAKGSVFDNGLKMLEHYGNNLQEVPTNQFFQEWSTSKEKMRKKYQNLTLRSALNAAIFSFQQIIVWIGFWNRLETVPHLGFLLQIPAVHNHTQENDIFLGTTEYQSVAVVVFLSAENRTVVWSAIWFFGNWWESIGNRYKEVFPGCNGWWFLALLTPSGDFTRSKSFDGFYHGFVFFFTGQAHLFAQFFKIEVFNDEFTGRAAGGRVTFVQCIDL